MLVIADPRENIRRTLELAFEDSAHVIVADPDKLGDQAAADLVVVAGDQSQQYLSSDEALQAVVRKAAAHGATLVLADRAPSAFNDFVFGLSDGWFAGSQSPEFPIGKLGTARQIEDLAHSLGFADAKLDEAEYPEGRLVSLIAQPKAVTEKPLAAEAVNGPLFVIGEGPSHASDFGGLATISVSADEPKPAYVEAFAKFAGQPVRAVYYAERASKEDPSKLSQDRLVTFALLQKRLPSTCSPAGRRKQPSAASSHRARRLAAFR
ncbi:hypothetical protein AJ87_08575 [Rhizobium yanglingense]|nr:hypothetical protein AJ87_08575 [Rhizobium yanglingense]